VSLPTVTIAIPTYNRRAKLQRLLEQIGEQARGLADASCLEVLVSNNCATDGTREFLEKFKTDSFNFRVIHQPVNVGGCRHLEQVHRESGGDYTWVFSDDDILFPGAIERVMQTINEHRPDLLRFSFVQPMGSGKRQFAYKDPVYLTEEKGEIARIVSIYPKVSSYVVKNEYISPYDPIFHYAGGFGWVWLGWSYAVLQLSSAPKVAVISEALAGCDKDEKEDWTRFGFATWWEYPRTYLHPFALTHAPELYHEHDLAMYRGWVQCYDSVQRGVLDRSYFANSLHCKPPLRWGPLLSDWRLCLCWVRGRLGKPWIYKLQGFLKQRLSA
jgi:glycosyltransferase involved in cell wall biosynthesis